MAEAEVIPFPQDEGGGGPDYISLPSNLEAEQALLGAIMLNNSSYHRVAGWLQPKHFAEPVHRKVFEALESEISAGRQANAVTVHPLFEHDEQFKNIGGAGYLGKLTGGVVTTLHLEDYGRTIVDCWRRCEIIRLCEDAQDLASKPQIGSDAGAVIAEIEQQLWRIDGGGSSTGPVALALSVDRTIEAMAARQNSKAARISTGLAELDRIIGGLYPGKVYVIGGRPAMGKSALSGTIGFNVAWRALEQLGDDARKRSVLIFSLEMDVDDWNQRFLARMTGIATDRQQRSEDLDGNDSERLAEAASTLRKLPIIVDDTAAVGLSYIRGVAERIARKNGGLGLIVIDYLQLMSQGGRVESRRLELGEISRGIKQLAKALKVPVILVSQLSRRVEERDDKRPTMADLKETGDIEQDADVIAFVYRHEYYLVRSQPRQRPDEKDDKFGDRNAAWSKQLEDSRNIGEIIIDKQRGGPTGLARCHWDGVKQKFSNLFMGDGS